MAAKFDKQILALKSMFLNFAESLPSEDDRNINRQLQIGEARRYGTFSESWLQLQKTLDARFVADTTAINTDLEHLKAIVTSGTDSELAWCKTIEFLIHRSRAETPWRENFSTALLAFADECPNSTQQTLYNRLEELDALTKELERYTAHREALVHMGTLYADMQDRSSRAAAHNTLAVAEMRMRATQEKGFAHLRMFEVEIINRARQCGIVTVECQEVKKDPNLVCLEALVALNDLVVIDQERRDGKVVPGEYVEGKQDIAEKYKDNVHDCTAKANAVRLMNNWILTEIRLKLRPDGFKLGFEDKVDRFYVHGPATVHQPQQQMSYAPQAKPQSFAVVQEQPPKEKSSFWCC